MSREMNAFWRATVVQPRTSQLANAYTSMRTSIWGAENAGVENARAITRKNLPEEIP